MKKRINDFLAALDNKTGGMSLRKLLAVGLFWVVAVETAQNTTTENLPEVLMIEVPGILTLAGIYSYFNYKEKKLNVENNNTNQPTPPIDEASQST